MEETVLNAIERKEKARKVREAGFIPGVLYGDGVSTSTSVKFEAPTLTKILARHGSNAKIWIKLGAKKKFGFIKEVQRHPVEGKVIHVDVQLVSKDQEVKLPLPITFTGRESLERRALLLQVFKSEIDVLGKPTLIPDVLVVDVSEKELGDTITSEDFNLHEQIKILDSKDEIYATVKAYRDQPAEEPGETEKEPDNQDITT